MGPNGQKFSQEDFASLAGLTNANGGSDFKYSNLSYEECADIIRKYVKAAPVEILKFFRIIVFNYLTLNDDAHLKNFSLINRGDGEYHLAPAYDLINTSLHLSMPRIFALDKGLFKEGMKLTDTRTVERKDFEEFGRRIGLSERLVKPFFSFRFLETELLAFIQVPTCYTNFHFQLTETEGDEVVANCVNLRSGCFQAYNKDSYPLAKWHTPQRIYSAGVLGCPYC